MSIYKIPKVIGKGQKPPFGVRVNWHHPLSQGLVNAWLFNEQGGKSVFDSVSKRPADPSAGMEPSWKGDYLDFSSVNLQFPVDNTSYLGDITVLVNLCLDTKVNYSHVVGKQSAANNSTNTPFSFWLDENTPQYMAIDRSNTTDYRRWKGQQLLLNQFYFCGFRASGSIEVAPTFFLDNAKAIGTSSGGTGTGLPTGNSNPIYIGSNLFRNYTVDGKIKYIYIWSRLLSDAEILSLYANPYQMFTHPVWDIYIVPEAAPPPAGGRSIFGYDSIFHAGGIIQT